MTGYRTMGFPMLSGFLQRSQLTSHELDLYAKICYDYRNSKLHSTLIHKAHPKFLMNGGGNWRTVIHVIIIYCSHFSQLG